MLLVFDKLRSLRFSELTEVYAESLGKDGAQRLLRAQQELYAYLRQEFFTRAGDRYCIWEEAGEYVCALRLQRFEDGLLLDALETRPSCRRRGYAQKLLEAVSESTRGVTLYSHIRFDNRASRALHEKCGFRKCRAFSRLADGSVDPHCATFCRE